MMDIRKAADTDFDVMWEIFQTAIAAGDAMPFSDGFGADTFRAHWFISQTAYVAVTEGTVVGMYKFGANYPGLGSHVASATYIVHPASQGMGIGRALVNHSIATARSQGFMAMQFNYVVSTNMPAVELYKKLGFEIVGTLPKAFKHRDLGLVDAYVMYQMFWPHDT